MIDLRACIEATAGGPFVQLCPTLSLYIDNFTLLA